MAAQGDPGRLWGRRPEISKDKRFLSVLVLPLSSPAMSVILALKPWLLLLPSAFSLISLILTCVPDSVITHLPTLALLFQSLLCTAAQEILLKHTSIHVILFPINFHWLPSSPSGYSFPLWNAHPLSFLEKDSSFITSSEKPS